MRMGALGIRAVAVFEALKGLLVVTVGFGALAAFHRDAQHFAESLVGHMHLNPARHDPQVFIDAMVRMNDARLWWLAALASMYAAFRLAIGWGLWFGRNWAEWMAIIAAGTYIPFEIYELAVAITPLHVSMFLANLLIVVVMAYALMSQRRLRVATR